MGDASSEPGDIALSGLRYAEDEKDDEATSLTGDESMIIESDESPCRTIGSPAVRTADFIGGLGRSSSSSSTTVSTLIPRLPLLSALSA